MKWINHKLLTGTLVYAITGNPIYSLISAAGSIVPDAAEGFPKSENDLSWRKNHRRLSHWIVPYLLTFFSCQAYSFLHPVPKTLHQFWVLANGNLTDQLPVLAWLAAASSLGACFHIAQDALCGKVPGLELEKYMGIRLFPVGSLKEYALVLPISLLLLFIRLQTN